MKEGEVGLAGFWAVCGGLLFALWQENFWAGAFMAILILVWSLAEGE